MRKIDIDTNAMFLSVPKELQKDKGMSEAFIKIVQSFQPGHFRMVDVSLIIHYVKANKQLDEAYKILERDGLIDVDGVASPAVKMIKDFQSIILATGGKLGIMASTRISSSVPSPTDKEDSEDTDLLM